MNILFISEDYYPYLSGVPVVVQYLAEGLSKKHKVHIATSVPLNDKNPITESVNGVCVHRFIIYRNLAKVLKGDIEGLQQYVMSSCFDVIIIECGQAATTDAILPILDQIKAPCIIHAHGLSGLLGKPFELKSDFKHTFGNTYNWIRMQRYYRYTFKNACKHFVASISLTSSDSGYAYLAKNINKNYVLGNAAEDMFFQQNCEAYDWKLCGKPYLVSIANFSVVKNQIGMMREFYRTKDKGYSLVMIGSHKNDYYEKMKMEKERLDQKYGYRSVEILTGINRLYFPSILDGASAYIVSSICEVFSISIIEALARGIPFISTAVGNAKELPGGLVVDSLDQMHIAIDNLLADDLKRKKLGKCGSQYAYDNCRRKTAVDNLEKIIQDVMNLN